MKAFTHVNATTVAEAAAALNNKAAAVAGNTDLLGYLKAMVSPNAPEKLVNLKTIPGLSYIKEEGGMLKIGALTTLTEIAENSTIQTKYTALAQAARKLGTPQLRNVGTIAGNICQKNRCWFFRNEHNAFPCLRKTTGGLCYALTSDNRYHSIFGAVGGCVAVCPSDTAPALMALNASVVTNKKTWAIKDFFAVNGEKQVAIADDEIVTEIQVPTPATGTKSAYRKFALRKAIDFPIVGAAVVLGGGNASICLSGVHNLPRRVTAAEDSIKGKPVNVANAEAAGAAAVTGATALAATQGPTNKYMIQITKVMVKRAILDCA
jgi:xanthine dehydrogenase YagS FAD-binding subunit